MGFTWTFKNGVQRFFQFNVLPFGLSKAPYIFTKLLRPLVKLWRSMGFHSLVYLDDGLGLEETYEKTEYAAHHTRGDLFAAGFVVAEEKSVWDPTQIIDWLGIKWNTKCGTILITDKLVTKAMSLTRIMTRHCQITVAVGEDWDTKHPLDNCCLFEIKFWVDNLHHVNSRYCFNSISHNKLVYSDASNYALRGISKGRQTNDLSQNVYT